MKGTILIITCLFSLSKLLFIFLNTIHHLIPRLNYNTQYVHYDPVRIEESQGQDLEQANSNGSAPESEEDL